MPGRRQPNHALPQRHLIKPTTPRLPQFHSNPLSKIFSASPRLRVFAIPGCHAPVLVGMPHGSPHHANQVVITLPMPRTLVTLSLLALLCLAATAKPTTRPAMDYGPFLSYSVIANWENREGPKKTDLALKAITIKLDENNTICFDTDLMRWAGAWTGGFLDLSKTHQVELKGSQPPSIDGRLIFTTPIAPGVSPTTTLDDPRPDHMGPLPREFAHYNGLYING